MVHRNGTSTAPGGGGADSSSRVPVTLSDEQWTALESLVPQNDGPARGRAAEPRHVLEGILYALRNGLGLQSVTAPYPSGSTLYRRFTAWTTGGQWGAIWSAFLSTLSDDERRQWEEAAARRPSPAVETARPRAQPAVQHAAQRDPQSQAQPALALPVEQRPAPETRHAEPPHVDQRSPIAEHSADEVEPARRLSAEEAEPVPPSASAEEAEPQAARLSAEAARDEVTERLQLSLAQSEIARRRIDDHGVSAALRALEETERRVATGTMQGVGGTQMSAFEIWVCAVGEARRPTERQRGQRPERSDRRDGDRDRGRRNWRKAP